MCPPGAACSCGRSGARSGLHLAFAVIVLLALVVSAAALAERAVLYALTAIFVTAFAVVAYGLHRLRVLTRPMQRNIRNARNAPLALPAPSKAIEAPRVPVTEYAEVSRVGSDAVTIVTDERTLHDVEPVRQRRSRFHRG